MRGLWFVALFVVLGASFSGGQQASPSAPSSVADAQPDRVKVYAVGPDVTAPELIPVNQESVLTQKCKKKVDDKVVLSVIVDATGKPRNLLFLRPLGTDLDKLALEVVAADRFKPGTYDGAPVVVAESVEVSLQACIEQTKKKRPGKKSRFGGGGGPSKRKSWKPSRNRRTTLSLQWIMSPGKTSST